MTTSPNDTQKIRAELTAQLREAVQSQEQQPSIDTAKVIRWLKEKLSFYNSNHYQEYKRQNGQMQ